MSLQERQYPSNKNPLRQVVSSQPFSPTTKNAQSQSYRASNYNTHRQHRRRDHLLRIGLERRQNQSRNRGTLSSRRQRDQRLENASTPRSPYDCPLFSRRRLRPDLRTMADRSKTPFQIVLFRMHHSIRVNRPCSKQRGNIDSRNRQPRIR